MLGDDRLAGMERIARRRIEPAGDLGDADDAGFPADAGEHQELVLRGQKLQHFREARAKTGGGEATGVLQHREDVTVLKGDEAELR